MSNPTETTATTETGQRGFSWLPDRPFRPLPSLGRHRWLAVGIWLVVASLAVPAAWLKGRPTYLSETSVLVSRTFLKNLKEDDETRFNSNSDYRQFVQQQTREITSFEVALAALERLEASPVQWQGEGETRRRAAERLMAALKVRAVPDTYLITIGLEGDKPDGLDVIVNAVAAAYLEKQKQDEIYDPARRIEHIQAQREQILAELGAATAEQGAIAQEIGVTTFVEKFLNPYDKVLSDGTEALASARRRRIEAEAKLRALEEHLDRVGSLEVESSAERLLANDRGVGDLKNLLLKRRAKVVLEMSGLTARHPGRAALDRELATIDTELEKATVGTLDGLRSMLRGERETKAASERSRAVAALEEARGVEQGLEAEVAAHGAKVAWFASRYHQALDLQRGIERDRDRLQTLEDRVQFFELESQAPGFVRIASLARPAEIPVEGGRRKWLLVFLVLATGLAVAVPVVADRLDPRVHTAEELRRLFGIAPMGWVPERDGARPGPVAEAQIRRLALSIDRDRRAHGTRSITLTAAEPGSGTTTVAFDLAAELGRLGVRALVVEANPLARDERFGSSASGAGFASVLAGRDELSQAIVAAADGLSDRLPLARPPGEFRLPGLDAMRRVIAEALQAFDVVLFDAAPAGMVPDMELVVRSADAAVLVVEAAATYRGQVLRAARELERLAPSAFGTILNRVRANADGHHATEVTAEAEAGRKRGPWLAARWLWSWT